MHDDDLTARELFFFKQKTAYDIRLSLVGSGSLKVLEQPALAGEFQESIMELLSRAESQIGQASFVANISEHCTGDSKCQLLIAKAVTHD